VTPVFDNLSGYRLKQAVNVFLGVAVMGGLFMLGVATLTGIGFGIAVVGGGTATDWQVIVSYLGLSGGLVLGGFVGLRLLNRLPGPTVAFV
jgi:hypothetical protein